MHEFFGCCDWFCRHETRLAEPKDYDISRAPVRDILKATYKHLGTVADVCVLVFVALLIFTRVGGLEFPISTRVQFW